MRIEQVDGSTMAQQIAGLGYKRISFRSALLLAFARVVHSGQTHVVKTAPAGKGTPTTVAIHEQLVAWELNADGTAKSGNFGSPRAANVVEADYEEVPGSPGIWRKKSVAEGFLVPDGAEIRLLNREGVEQEASPGDVVSTDRDGYCHVIPKAKFEKDFQIVGN